MWLGGSGYCGRVVCVTCCVTLDPQALTHSPLRHSHYTHNECSRWPQLEITSRSTEKYLRHSHYTHNECSRWPQLEITSHSTEKYLRHSQYTQYYTQ